MSMDDVLTMTPQSTDQRRRNAERSDFMPIHELPDPIWSRKVRGTVVKHHCRAEQQCAENFPWPHHPPHVRHPEKRLVRMQIEPLPHILRRFNRETAMCMHRAFWLTSRTRCVNDHHRIFRRRALGRLFNVGGAFGGDRRETEAPPTFSICHSPACLNVIRCLRAGICAAASSAIGFIAQNFPRRYVPSAVNIAFASASLSRETIPEPPHLETSGRK